jgi:hypothetical protein
MTRLLRGFGGQAKIKEEVMERLKRGNWILRAVMGIVAIGLLCLTGPGCATLTTTSGATTPVCDKVPEGQTSAICALAAKMGTKPETISRGIKVGNLVGLVKPYYTAKEAEIFLNKIKKVVEDARAKGATYTLDQAFEYAQTEYKLLDPIVQGIISIINPVDLSKYGIKLNMCDYDFELLLLGIDEQMKVVKPFLYL